MGIILGAEPTFCNGKPDGRYQSPNDNKYFLNCMNGQALPCQRCPGDLVFVEKCDQCMVHQPCKTTILRFLNISIPIVSFLINRIPRCFDRILYKSLM